MLKRAIFIIPVLITGFFLFSKISLADSNLSVIINEVAWMGTVESVNSEWLELYNNTDSDIDLSNWTLSATDDTPIIELSGVVGAHNYFLLERTSDNTLSQIATDQIYVGALGNTGENLELRDGDGNLIDFVDASLGWFSGDNDSKVTMERINPLLDGQSANWLDSNIIGGTPKAKNSVYSVPNIKPVAVAGDDQSGNIGEELFFDGSGSSDDDGSVVEYNWDFGDSNAMSGLNASHSYNWPGLYTVNLNIIDNNGATSSDNLVVNIIESVVATTTIDIKSGDVVINEFVSDPVTGEKEWVELYNSTTSTIDLLGFTILDGVGVIVNLQNTILPGDFKTIELSSSKLNNSGDKIVLKYQDSIIDQVVYGNWDDGDFVNNVAVVSSPNSIARKQDGHDTDVSIDDFTITTTLTKNNTNLITPIETKVDLPSPVTNQPASGSNNLPTLSFAKSSLVINEFVADPTDDDVEWVEIYNNTGSGINLKNWIIKDGSGKKTELSGLISGQQFKIIENPKGGLNNFGDLIILIDPSGNIIDQIAYGNYDDGNVFDNATNSSDPDAVARLGDGIDTNIDYNDFRLTSSPTKGLPNIINGLEYSVKEKVEAKEILIKNTTTLAIYPEIIITEALPNPVGSDMNDEFVELYNPNDQAVDLNSWVLDDVDGGSRPYVITDLVIEPHEYLAFFRSTTHLAFNNDTDQIRLINPSTVVASYVEYQSVGEGLSYSFDVNKEWQITEDPTPGEENSVVINKVVGASKKVTNNLVKITGTVLVEPGILGSQIFYIGSDNIQVYSYKKDFPDLMVGDIVTVSGELSEVSGQRRIKIKTSGDIKIIGKQLEVVPIIVTVAEIDESVIGQLVKIIGEVIEVKGNYVYIDDGSNEIKIYIKASTQIDKKLFVAGENVEIVGIVSRSGNDYRVLPRYGTDILIISEVRGEQDQNTDLIVKSDNKKYYVASIIFLILIVSWLVYGKYKNKIKPIN